MKKRMDDAPMNTNKKAGFKITCQECGNEVIFKDGIDRDDVSIFLYADQNPLDGRISIECEQCNRNDVICK